MSYFRLFDLPLDLLELLTLYFEGKETVKLFTVSSNFHDIFARSVWHTITRAAINVAEPTRSGAYARYGHLVRSINLFNELHLDLDSHNWAQLFPNTTSLAFDILYDMEDDDKQTFMDAIASLHGLRSLKIQMEINMPPFDLKTLTTTLVARHRDSSKQSLRELTLYFGIGSEDDVAEISWTNLCPIVQILSPLRPPIRLQIDASGYSNVVAPTPAQMNILRPHLASIPVFVEVEDEDEDVCTALRNRQNFSPTGTYDDPLVFSRIGTLRIRVCCASPHLFDYSDFTSAKFPAMETMQITGDMCNHLSEEGTTSAIHTLVLQKWPKLKDLKIVICGLTLSIVDKLIELNPQLTHLNTGICRSTNDSNCVLMLERMTGRLPHLTELTLRGDFPILVDSDWLQTTSPVDIRSSKLTYISISNFTLTHRLFEVLLALPNLYEMAFSRCILAEPELVMNEFKNRQTDKEDTAVGVRRLYVHIPAVNNSSWSTEVVLEMIACLPHLKSCTVYGDDPLSHAIKERYPIFYQSI
ncbi:hypothetical protein GQ42DRAFT_165582 [Ramicandelaber brevisporus]|nr:hypothetical protein GQ42DRAFT_165582 [Ramicandelaber brevisporus]